MSNPWVDFFILMYTFVTNTLKSIFRSPPDIRYKLFLEDDLVKDSLDVKMIPVFINRDHHIEIETKTERLCILSISKTAEKKGFCGLPILAHVDLTLHIIDIIDDEVIGSFDYKKGDFINYSEISNKHDIFIK